MQKINWVNEKGNVSAKVRKAVADQTAEKIKSVLGADAAFADLCDNVNGGISIPVAETKDGETIYAHLTMTVSTADPSVKKEKKQKPKKAETKDEEEIGNIFA